MSKASATLAFSVASILSNNNPSSEERQRALKRNAAAGPETTAHAASSAAPASESKRRRHQQREEASHKVPSADVVVNDRQIPGEDQRWSPKETSPASRSPSASPSSTREPAASPPCSEGFLVKDGITVELVGQELWKKFHRLGTEMIITKAGRRMFPTLKVRFSGLSQSQHYIVYLDLAPFDDKRYRYVYHSSQWMVAGAGDPPPSSNTFVHGDSPATGGVWTSAGVITFDKLKLTNNRVSQLQGQICLHSMHRYRPRLYIQEISHEEVQAANGAKDCDSYLESLLDRSRATMFEFPETVFTTVTAYQNQQITKLKIASNPFAKGFREATRTREPSMSDFAHSLLLNKTMSSVLAAAGNIPFSGMYGPGVPSALGLAAGLPGHSPLPLSPLGLPLFWPQPSPPLPVHVISPAHWPVLDEERPPAAAASAISPLNAGSGSPEAARDKNPS